MSDDARVELAGSHNWKTAWFHKVLYNLDGRKQKIVGKKIKWFVIIFFTGPLVYLGFQNQEPPKAKTEIQSAQTTYDSKPISIPEANGTSMSGNSEQSKKTRAVIRYLGPQLIIRPFADSVPPGSMVKAKLISGASNGPVRVELQEPVVINGETVAELGSVLLGRGTSTEDRLLIHFKKLISKEGAVQGISAEACDGEDKIVGIRGSKIGNTALKVAGSIGLGFIGGLATGLQETHSQNGLEIREPSLKNAALNGTAQAALDQSHEMMDSLKQAKPIIEVKAGTSIFVIFEPAPKEDTND